MVRLRFTLAIVAIAVVAWAVLPNLIANVVVNGKVVFSLEPSMPTEAGLNLFYSRMFLAALLVTGGLIVMASRRGHIT